MACVGSASGSRWEREPGGEAQGPHALLSSREAFDAQGGTRVGSSARCLPCWNLEDRGETGSGELGRKWWPASEEGLEALGRLGGRLEVTGA